MLGQSCYGLLIPLTDFDDLAVQCFLIHSKIILNKLIYVYHADHSISKGLADSISRSCCQRTDQDSLRDRDVPLHSADATLGQAEHSEEEDSSDDGGNNDAVFNGGHSDSLGDDGRDDGRESEDGEAEEGHKTVGDWIFPACDELKLLNHHNLQEAFLVFADDLHDLLRHCRLEPHFVIEVHHLGLLSLEVVLNLLPLPHLLLQHVLIVTLGSEVIGHGHAEPVADHRGDTEGQDSAGRSSGSNR